MSFAAGTRLAARKHCIPRWDAPRRVPVLCECAHIDSDRVSSHFLGKQTDRSRVTGKPEVIPGQKSAWGKCGATERNPLSDFLQSRFSVPIATSKQMSEIRRGSLSPAFRAAGCKLLLMREAPVDGQKECVRLLFSPVDHLKERMPFSKSEVLQGTLDLLVLKTLDSMGAMHGFGIALRLQQVSEDLLQLNQGTLYPALLRLEQRGWIVSRWGVSENNRRAKYYSLTRAGRKQLVEEAESWGRMSSMINRVLRPS
jgi:PadR family transcriptional regulator PadR